MCVACTYSVMSDSVTPRTVTHQALLSLQFPRQQYWSGLPFPTPKDLPDPGIEPASPALQADSLPTESPMKPYFSPEFSVNVLFFTLYSKL